MQCADTQNKGAGNTSDVIPKKDVISERVKHLLRETLLQPSFLLFSGRQLRLYHAARNLFERFREFLELICKFEFEFCRCGIFFLKDSNFWCVHVNVPWPVRAHAFPFRMLWLPRFMITHVYIYIYIYIYIFSIGDVATNHETIVEGRVNRSLILGLGGERQIEH